MELKEALISLQPNLSHSALTVARVNICVLFQMAKTWETLINR